MSDLMFVKVASPALGCESLDSLIGLSQYSSEVNSTNGMSSLSAGISLTLAKAKMNWVAKIDLQFPSLGEKYFN